MSKPIMWEALVEEAMGNPKTIAILQARIRVLREALEFYARHEHWMEVAEGADVAKLLIANSYLSDDLNGWGVAQAALAATEATDADV